MQTLAAVAWAPNQPLEIEMIDLQGPQTGEVLVRHAATGVCHTDAYTLSGRDPEGIFPAVLGHEGAGVVEELGAGVKGLEVGDHVIPLYIPECGHCDFCQSPKTNLCQSIRLTQGRGVMPNGTSRFSKGSKPIYHYMGTSTFSQWSVVPEISLAKINPKAPLEKVCLLGCGITTGIGAVRHTAKVEPGSSVAVFGLGGIGLSVVQGAVMAGAETIYAIDINPAKFELATQLGATHTINPKDLTASLAEALVEMTQGGFDYTFECVGQVDLMRSALESCHKGWGKSVIIGVAGAGEEISTRPFQLVTGRTWKGTAFGGVKGRSQLPAMVDEYLDSKIKIDPMITQTLGFSEINHAFELMHQGQAVRSVLIYDN